MWSIILNIFLAAFVTSCVMAAQEMLNDEKEENSAVIPIIIGLVVGSINFFSPLVPTWLSVLFVVLMILLFMALVYEWKKNGDTLKEMAPFLILSVAFWLVMRSAIAAVAAETASGILGILPTIILIATIAFLLVDYLLFSMNYKDVNKQYYRGMIAFVVVLAGVLIVALCVSAFDGEKEAYASSGTSYHYYNDDVRNDNDANNNYNFGPSPYIEGKDASYYAEDFANRRDKDPALLSATALTLDAVTGSDYIGQILYEGYSKKLDVLQRANAATIVLADEENTKIFKSANQAIDEMLASATSVELVKEENIRDQLYMNGYTINNIPQVVIYETDVTSDWCLVYTFQIKSSAVKVAFRIPCGYQWTNPTEVLNTTTGSGGSGGGGYTPSPQPTPTPVKKDPTKDPVYQGNADIGGGKNKESDGTGDYQAEKPSKESGKNADSGSSSSSGKSGSGGSSSGGSTAPATDPITPHDDSHDTGESSAGNNNGEFSMD